MTVRRKLPSTQALICFEASARHESFTKAAHELALTQSAVYRQVTGLEEFLGVKLFRRSRHGIVLTEAGQGYGRVVARRLDAIERDTLSVIGRSGASGAIELAVVPTFATRWLLPRLARFRERHPEIVVNLETRTRPFLFAETDFDAALYAGTQADIANWPGTQAIALLPEIVVPVCSPKLVGGRRRVAPQRIGELPLLQQSTRPYAWRQWFEAQGVEGVRDLDGPRFELFSMAAVAAANGMGVALMPTLLIEDELSRGELVVPCDRPLNGGRAYHLVMPERKAGNPVLEAFRQWLLQEVAAHGAPEPTLSPESGTGPRRASVTRARAGASVGVG